MGSNPTLSANIFSYSRLPASRDIRPQVALPLNGDEPDAANARIDQAPQWQARRRVQQADRCAGEQTQ